MIALRNRILPKPLIGLMTAALLVIPAAQAQKKDPPKPAAPAAKPAAPAAKPATPAGGGVGRRVSRSHDRRRIDLQRRDHWRRDDSRARRNHWRRRCDDSWCDHWRRGCQSRCDYWRRRRSRWSNRCGWLSRCIARWRGSRWSTRWSSSRRSGRWGASRDGEPHGSARTGRSGASRQHHGARHA